MKLIILVFSCLVAVASADGIGLFTSVYNISKMMLLIVDTLVSRIILLFNDGWSSFISNCIAALDGIFAIILTLPDVPTLPALTSTLPTVTELTTPALG
ncbi:hypothetical protein CHUAL_013342 [Chamberlinius hualienensis]